MFTELSPTSTTRTAPPAPTSRRPRTIALESQAAVKFGLAVVLGISAVWATMPHVAAALLLVIAVTLAARSLTVLAAEPGAARTLRPREHATWDGLLAACLAALAIVLAITGDGVGAAIAGASGLALAGLRLRTRYVAA